ncbi:MAG: circularly permuted type 2 ATP-grasp protein [Thermoleophilaceae bacterium]
MTGTVEDESRPAAVYRTGAAWDEACTKDGSPRAHYAGLMEGLAGADLGELSRRVQSHLRAAGVSFGGGGGSAFRVDPVPRILPADEWSHLKAGVAQRTRALAEFVSDVYGERRIVDAGHMPARAIESAGHFEPWMMGVETPAPGYVGGLDLVRGAEGDLRVLEDNIRTPSGIAYLLAVRDAVDAHLPMGSPEARRDPSSAYDTLAQTLRDAAPGDVVDPSVVVLSDGPQNSAWWEHGQIAQALRLPLVGPSSLFCRGGRLHAEVDGDTRQVDVVYRRTDEDRLRDGNGRATWIADLLLEPVRQGTLAVVNPLGCGVADDKLVHAYVETMVRFYLEEEPVLRSVPTHDLGDPEVRESALSRIGELVVKPRGGLGGQGIVVGPHASSETLREIANRVAENPEEWIAQELVALSTHPTVCAGRLEPRHVDLRPFAIGGPGKAQVVPGGLTRVAFDRGNIVVNSSQNGGGKDTWVIA